MPLGWLAKDLFFSGISIVTVITMYISTRNLESVKDLLAKAVTVGVGVVVVVGHTYGIIKTVQCKYIFHRI